MIITTICKLLLALSVGWYLSKKNIFTPQVCQKLSFFVMNITMPLMIVTSLSSAASADKGEILRYIGVGAAFYIVLPMLAKIFNWTMKIPNEKKPVYEAFYIFSNNMFMGYPVAASLYGNGCIFQLGMFNLGFNVLFYTYGTKLFGNGNTDSGGFKWKNLLSTGTFASVIAIVMFFTGLKLPDAAADVCNYLGDISSPLSMVVIGASIGAYSLTNILGDDKKLYLVALIRLILMPIVTYAIMNLLGFDALLSGVATVAMGMPVASVISMRCIEFKYEEKLGSSAVVLTTILSLLTIPVMLIILS